MEQSIYMDDDTVARFFLLQWDVLGTVASTSNSILLPGLQSLAIDNWLAVHHLLWPSRGLLRSWSTTYVRERVTWGPGWKVSSFATPSHFKDLEVHKFTIFLPCYPSSFRYWADVWNRLVAVLTELVHLVVEFRHHNTPGIFQKHYVEFNNGYSFGNLMGIEEDELALAAFKAT
jgi:hypothetical protein